MKYNTQLDPTVSEVLYNKRYEQDISLPLQNPTNILSQQKSDIITNPFIKPKLKKEEDLKSPKFSEINENLSSSVLGFFDDLFIKPSDESWRDYIPMILAKDDRYNYIGVFLLLVAFYILLVK